MILRTNGEIAKVFLQNPFENFDVKILLLFSFVIENNEIVRFV